MAPINIKITANSVPGTDLQAVADKLYAALATECNTIDVKVTTTVTRPTEVTFRPQLSPLPEGYRDWTYAMRKPASR